MAHLTRADFETRVRDMADATGATRDWPSALVRALGDTVFNNEWATILRASPHYRTNLVTLSVDADGEASYSDLTTGTGNDVRRPFRILEVRDSGGNEIYYVPPSRVQLVGDIDTTVQTACFTKFGSTLRFFGLTSADVSVLVNYRPPLITNLLANTSIIDFPDEAMPILWLETAAIMLSKGGREVAEAQALQHMADRIRQPFLDDIRKTYASPEMIPAGDDLTDWI